IYSLAGRRPTQQMIESGGEKLLDIVQSEPPDKFSRILVRAYYALVESKTAGFVKRNRQTGEEYTLYDVIHASKDPVATFVKHYEWIVEEAEKWAEDLERKKKEENPRAGRLMTFPDAITGEEE
ncbi:MAG: hypothetical protein IRZ03_17855, partial [Acidobacterium ailaaui]|nr:hypothetical protein [Pseudacidobacterium ailaaui]